MVFCWHCGEGFPPNTNHDAAKFVMDPLGHRHRVHHTCYDAAQRSVSKITAHAREETLYEDDGLAGAQWRSHHYDD